MNRSRRSLLKKGIGLFGTAAGLSAMEPGSLWSAFASPQTPARGGNGPASAGTTLVLLGTQGGPIVNLGRGEAANAVLVDGQPYLVDCGYGTLRALTQAGIRFPEVRNVFITHLHDDHTSDIAALLSHQWTNANAEPQSTVVHGPYGTKALVDGAIAFMKANTDIRMTDEGRTIRPEAVFSGRDLSAPKSSEVFKDARITVRAVENTHFPERAKQRMPHRSLAYRVTAADKAIVFSGDTAYSTALVELAQGADIFVCEAMDVALREQMRRDEGTAIGNGESIARHIIETHSSTEDVGRMAAEAKVKKVVLNHLVPGSNPQRREIADELYISAVKKFFQGDVIVGRDLMRI